jgi:hypothetical protein
MSNVALTTTVEDHERWNRDPNPVVSRVSASLTGWSVADLVVRRGLHEPDGAARPRMWNLSPRRLTACSGFMSCSNLANSARCRLKRGLPAGLGRRQKHDMPTTADAVDSYTRRSSRYSTLPQPVSVERFVRQLSSVRSARAGAPPVLCLPW